MMMLVEDKPTPQIYQINNVANYHLPDGHAYFNNIGR